MINLKQIIQEIEEEKKGIWHNIRAKKARGEKPAKKGSKAYKKAEKAIKDLQDGTCECEDCSCGDTVTEAKFYVTYNKGRGQGKAVVKSKESDYEKPRVFKNYNDAEKYVKRAKSGGSMAGQITSYWVSDINMHRIDKRGKVEEAEYQGRDVKLNKPTRGDTKKFKVYVNTGKKNKDGSMKIKKVEFGARGSENRIKKSDPARRKSFRARHKCDQKKDKTSAGYWSCKKW